MARKLNDGRNSQEVKLEAAEMLGRGYSKLSVRKELHISQGTMDKWYGESDFKELIDDFKTAAVEYAKKKLISNVNTLMDNMIDLALKGKTENIKFSATKYLIDKAMQNDLVSVNKTDDSKGKDDKENIIINVDDFIKKGK